MKKFLIALFFAFCAPAYAANNPASILVVNSTAALSAIPTPSLYPSVRVTGRIAGSIYGGGDFVYVAGSSVAVNPCTVFTAVGGRWFRQTSELTPDMCGQTQTSDDSTAMNAVVAQACVSGMPVHLDRAAYIIKSTWDTTWLRGCNAGLTIYGNGMNSTAVTFVAAINQTGTGWDMTGLAYGSFKNFSFYGGQNASANSPQITLKQGAACTTNTTPCTGGFVFAGLSNFENVRIQSYQGIATIANAGAEQIHYLNCVIQSVTSLVTYNLYDDASGVTPVYGSTVARSYSPVSSMTQVTVDGSQSVFNFAGTYGFFTHYAGTGASGTADIHINGFIGNLSTSGTSIAFADDAIGRSGTVMGNVGGINIQYECDGGNLSMLLSSNGAANTYGMQFTGFGGAAGTLTAPPINFFAGTVLTGGNFNYNPNLGGGYSGTYLIVGGTGALFNGVVAQAPLVKANIITGGTSNSVVRIGTDGHD